MMRIYTVLLCCIVLFNSVYPGAGQDFAAMVQEEIERQLGEDASMLEQEVSSVVEQELDKHMTYALHEREEKKDDEPPKKILASGGGGKGIDKTVIYKVPKWPVQSMVFNKKDMLGVHVKGNWATKSYGPSGGSKDVSHLVLKPEPIYLKDVVLAMRLIEDGTIELVSSAPSKYDFLEYLKDQCLTFDASVQKQEIAFSYVRHFLRGDISVGFNIPIVRRVNKIKLTSTISNGDKAKLHSTFTTNYPDGLIDLFKEVLTKKQISFNESDTETGLGDIEAFCNYEVTTRHCERCLVGLRVLFPTSRHRDVYKFWDPELGNGGFTELSLFGSLLFSKHRFFNPHCYVQFNYDVPNKVFRRVPKLISSSDMTEDEQTAAKTKFNEGFMIYGNAVKWKQYASETPKYRVFSELDATVKRFSTTTHKTKISRGSSVLFRVGNMIEKVFSPRMFIDLYYELFAKGRDYTGFRTPCDVYDPSVLTKNTFEVSHKVCGNWSWQADDSWRLHLGGNYTFAGRNTLKAYEVNGAVTLEF